ncbi:MAG: TIGR03560 family F420-dependent LLM class oxidoreductase [Aggregatilineales bacterium]
MQIGIMIEGQDGLNWERWKRLLSAVEDLGFQCLFRSDHYTNPTGSDKDSLELWVSLTYAASHTKRIEFGPMVAPVTFRQPAMTVRMASQVDDLSEGRLVLGLGAGWQEREHTKFGIPFYDFPTRYEMFEDALEITMRLLMSDGAVSYDGKHFQLDDAILLPRPSRPGGPPVLIGGNGPKKTLPLVAKYADEWNAVFLDLETLKERNALLDDLLKQNGRDASEMRRSMMTGTVFARDDAEFQSMLKSRSEAAGKEITVKDFEARGIIYGTPSMFVDQLNKVAELGLDRIMLQWGDQDDIDGLEILARDVLPHFHK